MRAPGQRVDGGEPLGGSGRWQPAAAGLLLLVAFWLAAAGGHAANVWVSRAVVVAAAGLLVAYIAGRVRRLWSSGGAEGRILLALVAASFLVHFAGLGHDIAHDYFRDEGTYRQAAQEINRGRLLRAWFIYPHLLFYLDAIALWIASLFEPVVSLVARALYDLDNPHQIRLLVVRHVTATMGALTVLPVFAIARRLGGTAGAVLGGALVVLSPLYIQVAHLNISDVPAALFATLTLAAVAALVDGEDWRGWAWAGLWAGLAAGSKYPAGVVAVAIVAAALRSSLVKRRFPAGLLTAGVAAVAAFVAATPSLLAFPGMVLRGGGSDILFGFRQYSGTGWTGVVYASNAGYYLELLRFSLGVPVLAGGLVGLVASPPETRRRLLWLLPFPLLYLALILRMNVAVHRNLLPVLPALAAFAGVGLAALVAHAGRLGPARRRAVVAAGLAVCFAGPLYRTVEETVRHLRDTTRDVAAAWVHANLPEGSVFLQEFYTPNLGNRWRYPHWRKRFATRFTDEELRHPGHDFLLLASDAYQRYLEPGSLERAEWDDALAERYRELFRTFELVREFTPGRWQAGPTLRLHRLDPQPVVFADGARLAADSALVSNRIMQPKDGAIPHRHLDNQWSLFKAHLAAGRYRVAVEADLSGALGRLRASNRDGAEIAVRDIPAGKRLELELPADDKYFLYVQLPAGSRLRGLAVERMHELPAPEGVAHGAR